TGSAGETQMEIRESPVVRRTKEEHWDFWGHPVRHRCFTTECRHNAGLGQWPEDLSPSLHFIRRFTGPDGQFTGGFLAIKFLPDVEKWQNTQIQNSPTQHSNNKASKLKKEVTPSIIGKIRRFKHT
ncbi:hypothetical protein HAX54_017178, partial [Datura stramonium]|nr:hypothetical protein [Datura stramonium]